MRDEKNASMQFSLIKNIFTLLNLLLPLALLIILYKDLQYELEGSYLPDLCQNRQNDKTKADKFSTEFAIGIESGVEIQRRLRRLHKT